MTTAILTLAMLVTAQCQYAPAPPQVFAPTNRAHFADYDNIVVTAKDSVWCTSALTREASGRVKTESTWSMPIDLNVAVDNAKGAVFCGGKDAAYGGKYMQLFVADAGVSGEAGKVLGWDVVEDPTDAAKIKLANKWTVYTASGAQPVDVECGPKDGLFIADNGRNAIFWISNADLVAKKEDAAQAVIPDECGAVVAKVRSLNYNADSGKLSWTNNDEIVTENAGVFSYSAPADTTPEPASCKPENCDSWSTNCNSKIKQVEPALPGEKVWAVADAWGRMQLSKGDAKVYDTSKEQPIAEVTQEATYMRATNDPSRDVLLVADEKVGEVVSVSQGSNKTSVVADIRNAVGVAYNNAHGWTRIGSQRCTTQEQNSAKAVVELCNSAYSQCTTAAGSHNGKRCVCFKVLSECVNNVRCAADTTPLPLDMCVARTGCTMDACQALFRNSTPCDGDCLSTVCESVACGSDDIKAGKEQFCFCVRDHIKCLGGRVGALAAKCDASNAIDGSYAATCPELCFALPNVTPLQSPASGGTDAASDAPQRRLIVGACVVLVSSLILV